MRSCHLGPPFRHIIDLRTITIAAFPVVTKIIIIGIVIFAIVVVIIDIIIVTIIVAVVTRFFTLPFAR